MDHVKIMEDELLPFAAKNLPVSWTNQQDNCPIHVISAVLQCFSPQGTRIIKWPSRSPDLNPIENVWGWLVRKLYDVCRQFNSFQQLSECMRDSWEIITQSYIDSLQIYVKILCGESDSIIFD